MSKIRDSAREDYITHLEDMIEKLQAEKAP